MKKTLAIALLLIFGTKLQAAEERRIQAPPPMLIKNVPVFTGLANEYSGTEGRYWYIVNKNDNTVTVYDISDPERPVLISENEYEARHKEEKRKKEAAE